MIDSEFALLYNHFNPIGRILKGMIVDAMK